MVIANHFTGIPFLRRLSISQKMYLYLPAKFLFSSYNSKHLFILKTIPKSKMKYNNVKDIKPKIPRIFSNSGRSSIIPTVHVKNNTAKNIVKSRKSSAIVFVFSSFKSISLFFLIPNPNLIILQGMPLV